MKVLIADDHDSDRNSLARLLADAKYDVAVAEDGKAALRIALSMTEPYIALLDWVMPGLNGVQLCMCLRSPKLSLRPYVIVMSEKSDKKEVATALDFGADDYVTKPIEAVELLARLRAASRILQYQIDLQQQITELDALAKRYGMLGEIVAQHGQKHATRPAENPVVTAHRPATAVVPTKSPPPAVKPPPAGTAHEKPKAPEPSLVDLSSEEADEILQRIIRDLRFGNVGVIAKVAGDGYARAKHTIWAGFILEREQVWYDLLLEVDAAAMAMIFEQTMGRPPESEQERRDFLVETGTIFASGFKAALTAKGARVITPLLSRILRNRDEIELSSTSRRETFKYVLPGGSVGVTILRHACPLNRKNTLTLNVFDVTAEDVPPRQPDGMVWVSKGSVLTTRYIRKLSTLDSKGLERMTVPVYPCSPIASRFLAEAPNEIGTAVVEH